MVLGAGAYFYFVVNFKTIIGHATRISQLEVIVGIIGILVLAETCRRVVGIPILCVATVFIVYAFYSGLGAGRPFPQVLKSIVYNLFYTTSGVIGTPIGVCSTYIALFILFGAFLEATGISEFFIQLANSLAGASTGGPAKVAVISSALCGMVSGSSVGNTVTTGSVTILLVTLVAMVMMGYTMSRSAVIATLLAILVSIPNKNTRMNPTRFVNALETGGKNTLSVAVACGIAGIIALFLTMLTCIVLGMGVPTTANYIIMATTCAPILVNGMGINKIAANMFVFYFGIVADITPPVALAAYAGSAIAKSNPMKTALNASRLAIAAFIVPYIFAFNPAMLFIDADVIQVVTIIVTSLVGLTGVSGGLEGYMVTNMNPIQRILAVVGGLCLIIPGAVTDLAGIAIVGASVVWQLADKKKCAAA